MVCTVQASEGLGDREGGGVRGEGERRNEREEDEVST